ncbi:MAG: 1-deoxy-D-xylulose-5-phosphate synthase [Candidatus Nanopelagicales bacterium]|nr:1-deoxy-D-xylulose-5-phosphate synthase [Candidatus Nanopelagicales bacterium]MDP4824985.1 1-deoxy-D-xylulose-5-phosphate synthase [Candidatus Nanopelagicales bacterium]MDP4887731.1 1-deoxy-D-xylulose-5-phosphate synthase [Candidatus Nanopelagicales bacterium]
MSLLAGINGPADLADLTQDQLESLALEIRAFLVDRVARTGGHLGPNLGVVELTIALHRVFDSPRDVLLFDTGHQAYVHKILTGRAHQFDTLRQPGGLSGYPSRMESEHDVIENSHASTSLSYADGIAKGFQLDGSLGGDNGRHVVAVIGDGALTGGMSWEALNNIAAAERPLIIVVNDNERSYSPTIGGLAHHLSTLRTTRGYERFLDWGRRMLKRTPMVGDPVYDALHGMKKGIKDVVAPQGLFEDLGLKYIGPIHGHDEAEVEHALRRAAAFLGPVIVHVITEKGRGYAPAELDDADRFHGVGVIDPDTGRPLSSNGPTWTSVFADELCRIGSDNDRVVAITAAMPGPTGIASFGRSFPDRMFDVGIAEQHAATSAAGLAFAGHHPVVAVYATFLNRAFDQVLMDVALHRAGVTFVLDRAGVTGDDGPSHNGVWDISMLSIVPGLRLAAPRDEATLRRALREAIEVDDAPTVVRFPKGSLGGAIDPVCQLDGMDVLREFTHPDVLVIAAGSMVPVALDVADRLGDQGITVAVIDPRWLFPINPALVTACGKAARVITIEDGLRRSGMGSALRDELVQHRVGTPVWTFGLPEEFLDQSSRAELLTRHGLAAQDISRQVVEWVSEEVVVSDVAAGSDQR